MVSNHAQTEDLRTCNTFSVVLMTSASRVFSAVLGAVMIGSGNQPKGVIKGSMWLQHACMPNSLASVTCEEMHSLQPYG